MLEGGKKVAFFVQFSRLYDESDKIKLRASVIENRRTPR